jgi:hypothetical protein
VSGKDSEGQTEEREREKERERERERDPTRSLTLPHPFPHWGGLDEKIEGRGSQKLAPSGQPIRQKEYERGRGAHQTEEEHVSSEGNTHIQSQEKAISVIHCIVGVDIGHL